MRKEKVNGKEVTMWDHDEDESVAWKEAEKEVEKGNTICLSDLMCISEKKIK